MSEQFDPTAPLVASGNLRRRQAVSTVAATAARLAAAAAVAVLGLVLFTVIKKAASSLSLSFITKPPPLIAVPGGGIGPELVGTIVIVALATVLAAPIGLLSALYVTEFAGARGARVIRTALDTMQGFPSIIVGVVVFGLVVEGTGQSGYAASLALAIIMLPLVSRDEPGGDPARADDAQRGFGGTRDEPLADDHRGRAAIRPTGDHDRYDPCDRARRRGDSAADPPLLRL